LLARSNGIPVRFKSLAFQIGFGSFQAALFYRLLHLYRPGLEITKKEKSGNSGKGFAPFFQPSSLILNLQTTAKCDERSGHRRFHKGGNAAQTANAARGLPQGPLQELASQAAGLD